MSDRPPKRDIERTLGTGNGPADPGEGLRGHVARSPRRPVMPAPQPAPAPAYGSPYAPVPMPAYPPPQPPQVPVAVMLDVRGPDGSIVKSYGPEDEEAARLQAQSIEGCVSIAEVVADYRR